MKKKLLLALLFAGLGTTPALAAGTYVSGALGIGIPGDYTFSSGGSTYRTTFDTGVPFNAAFGYDFGDARTEFAIGYENYGMDTITVGSTKYKVSDYTDSADGSAWSFMANGYMDLAKGNDITPYAMGGAGFTKIKESATVSGVTVSSDETCFAWQLGAGVGFRISKNVTGDLGYRYIKPTGLDYNGSINMHHILAGVRYNF